MGPSAGRGPGRLALCLVALAVVGAGCARTPAAVQAWDDEVTGAVAQVNDVVALELLLGLVDVQDAGPGVVDGRGATPDLVRVRAACVRLADLTPAFVPLAASAPLTRADVAPKVAELGRRLDEIASVCVEVVDERPGALLGNDDLEVGFREAGALIALIGSQLHDGAECPPRLREAIRTCTEA